MAWDDSASKIWMDGNMVDWKDAKIHALSHVVHYGTSVFEGIRAYDNKKGTCIFRLNEHVKRLFNSAKVYKSHAVGQHNLRRKLHRQLGILLKSMS